MVETCVVAGMTLAKAENRDTVLGGVADSDDCYLELVQPGGCIVCVCVCVWGSVHPVIVLCWD